MKPSLPTPPCPYAADEGHVAHRCPVCAYEEPIEDEIDGCLHGVGWDTDCWECQLEENKLDGF